LKAPSHTETAQTIGHCPSACLPACLPVPEEKEGDDGELVMVIIAKSNRACFSIAQITLAAAAAAASIEQLCFTVSARLFPLPSRISRQVSSIVLCTSSSSSYGAAYCCTCTRTIE